MEDKIKDKNHLKHISFDNNFSSISNYRKCKLLSKYIFLLSQFIVFIDNPGFFLNEIPNKLIWKKKRLI